MNFGSSFALSLSPQPLAVASAKTAFFVSLSFQARSACPEHPEATDLVLTAARLARELCRFGAESLGLRVSAEFLILL